MTLSLPRLFREGEIPVVILVILLILGGYLAGWFDGFEVKTLDARFRARGASGFQEQICLLYITDECIQKLGGWPWARARHAQVVD